MKIILTLDKSGKHYNIQYFNENGQPKYLGIVPADYLQTAIWFYTMENIDVEVVR